MRTFLALTTRTHLIIDKLKDTSSTINLQTLINTVLPLICVAIGWFCKELWTAVQELKDDIAKIREELPSEYVSKADFNDRWFEVLKSLHRIEDKLDNKVDK